MAPELHLGLLARRPSDLEASTVQCPYCWETIEVLVDPSVPLQEYVEDCQVCCRPIVLRVAVDHEGGTTIAVRSENE